MRSYFLTLIYFSILAMGFRAPYMIVLGYIWVDIFTPQVLAYSILPSLKVSLMLGVLAFIFYFRLPRDPEVKMRNVSITTIIFSIWITLTLIWAVVPDTAYERWDTAIKSLLISIILPSFLRTRIQIEAFVWTITLAGIAHCIATGLKVFISGSSYGAQIGLVQSNSGWGESSSLAMYAITLIPLCLFLLKYQTLFPYPKIGRLMLMTFIVLAFMTAVGTFARTGLICALVLGIMLVLTTKNKFTYLILGAATAIVVLLTADPAWLERMSTTNDGTEGSAMGRVAVWLWTLDYVAEHPFGGSFEVNRIIRTAIELKNGTSLTVTGKAFHSIYFQVLGETGIPGFLLFSLIILFTWSNFKKVKKLGAKNNDPWLNSLGAYMVIVLYVFLAGGAFIGVAFQSYFYYLAAFSAALLTFAQRKTPAYAA